MTEYEIPEVGVDQKLQIEGELTILHVAEGHPVVFLVDEYHEEPDAHHENITQNIANVQQLVEHADVQLIGVESHHRNDVGMGAECNRSTRLANHFNDAGDVPVLGVESEEILGMMEQDLGAGAGPAEIGPYPLNYLRSYYYVAALFRHRTLRNLGGNMVLNAGRNHIDHIVRLLEWGGIEQLAGIPASYVRIRATAYPAAEE